MLPSNEKIRSSTDVPQLCGSRLISGELPGPRNPAKLGSCKTARSRLDEIHDRLCSTVSPTNDLRSIGDGLRMLRTNGRTDEKVIASFALLAINDSAERNNRSLRKHLELSTIFSFFSLRSSMKHRAPFLPIYDNIELGWQQKFHVFEIVTFSRLTLDGCAFPFLLDKHQSDCSPRQYCG